MIGGEMKHYWIPKYKYQLLKWFKDNRPDWEQSELRKKGIKELFAIYFKIRDGG